MGFWEAFLNWLRRYDALPFGLLRRIDLLRIARPGCGGGGEGRPVGDLKVLLVFLGLVEIVTDAVKLQLACGKPLVCSNVIITA
jgi:hypothetical protein